MESRYWCYGPFLQLYTPTSMVCEFLIGGFCVVTKFIPLQCQHVAKVADGLNRAHGIDAEVGEFKFGACALIIHRKLGDRKSDRLQHPVGSLSHLRVSKPPFDR